MSGRRHIEEGPVKRHPVHCVAIKLGYFEWLSPAMSLACLNSRRSRSFVGEWRRWRKCDGGQRKPNGAPPRPHTARSARPSCSSPRTGGVLSNSSRIAGASRARARLRQRKPPRGKGLLRRLRRVRVLRPTVEGTSVGGGRTTRPLGTDPAAISIWASCSRESVVEST